MRSLLWWVRLVRTEAPVRSVVSPVQDLDDVLEELLAGWDDY